jgi:hypothetical protein
MKNNFDSTPKLNPTIKRIQFEVLTVVTAQIDFSGDWDIPNPQNHDLKVFDKSLESLAKFR